MAISTSDSQSMEAAKVPSQTTTNQILGNLINACCSTNQPIPIPRYTTLNEAFEVLATESIGTKNGRDFELKYYMIGRRGASSVGVDEEGVQILKANQHQPIDFNLFTPIPHIGRPVSNDLTEIERKNFRLRVVLPHNETGEDWAFYYLKLIDFDDYNPSMISILRDPTTGTENTSPFIPSEDGLHPEPIDLTSENTTPVSNTYVNSSAMLNCSLDANAVAELKNVCQVLYGDSSRAAINEVAICWGIDTTTQANVGTGIINYTEVLSAVPAHFVTERDARNANNNSSISLVFDHATSEPKLLHTVA